MAKKNNRSVRLFPGLLFLILLVLPAAAAGLEVFPFATRNYCPLVASYGLPVLHDAETLPQGQWQAGAGLAIANSFDKDQIGAENMVLDGETYRYSLTLRRGLSGSMEAGVDVPFVRHSGGHFDSFIESFHDLIGVAQGNRQNDSPRNRLHYRYIVDGITKINVDSAAQGLGDISFQFGYQLYKTGESAPRSAALRVNLKLPTGDTDNLFGSGSTDLAFSIAGSDARTFDFLNITWYGEAGIMALTDGTLLPDQQRNVVGFATVGLGWRPWDFIVFKAQLDGNTPFYRNSSIAELSTTAVQFVLGGTLALPARFSLDIGVIEEQVADTVPDVTFHFLLRKTF